MSNTLRISQEDGAIENWLGDTTEQFNDWEWDGETLTVFTDSGVEKHSYRDLEEAGVFKHIGPRAEAA